MEDGDQSRPDLHQQLGQGGQGEDVVEDAQDDDDDPAHQHPPQLGGEGEEEQHAEQEAEKDGQPPHAGDGVVVHPAAVLGDVHRPHPEGQGADHRRGEQGHQGGGSQSRGGGADGGKLYGHRNSSL